MPFTFAHPCYALPLKFLKPKYFSITGLVLGSMAPDFEYFIALEPYQTIGHSAKGLIFQGIPISILFAYLFHYMVKKPFILHLPTIYDLDIRAFSLIKEWGLDSLRKWIIFLISVVIGFYSHLFLDAFTHQTGKYISLFPILQHELVTLPIYKWLQYFLSLMGLFILAGWILFMLHKTPIHPKILRKSIKEKLLYWSIVFVTALIILGLKLFFTTSSNLLGILIVASISGTSLGIVIASLLFSVKTKEL